MASKDYRILTVDQARAQARVEGDKVVQVVDMQGDDLPMPSNDDTISSTASDIDWGLLAGCAIVACLFLLCVGALIIASVR